MVLETESSSASVISRLSFFPNIGQVDFMRQWNFNVLSDSGSQGRKTRVKLILKEIECSNCLSVLDHVSRDRNLQHYQDFKTFIFPITWDMRHWNFNVLSDSGLPGRRTKVEIHLQEHKCSNCLRILAHGIGDRILQHLCNFKSFIFPQHWSG